MDHIASEIEQKAEDGETLSRPAFIASSLSLLIVSSLYVWTLCSTYILSYDMGWIPVGSDLLLRGGLLYRDMHTVMFPGSYFLLFIVFSIFGTALPVCQISVSAIILSIAIVLTLIARIFVRDFQVFIPAALVVVIGTICCPYISHHWDSLLFILVFTYLLIHQSSKKFQSNLLNFCGGLAGGLSILCYQNQLFPVAVSMLVLGLILNGMEFSKKEILKKLTVFAAGILLPLALLFVYLLATGTFSDFIECTISFVLNCYGSVNRVPFGWSNFVESTIGNRNFPWDFFAGLPYGLIKLAPVIVFGGVLLYRIKFGSFKEIVRNQPGLFILFVLSFSIWLAEFHKPDFRRMIWGEPLIIVCFFYLANQVKFKSARLLLNSFFLCLAVGLVVNAAAIKRSYTEDAKVYETKRGAVSSIVDLTILKKLGERTRPYEEVLIYPYDTGLIYLSKTKFAGTLPTLHYGYHSNSQFKSVVDDMDKAKVQYAVINHAMNDKNFAEFDFPGYVKWKEEDMVVEPYLKKHYEPVGSFGIYSLLKRKSESESENLQSD